MASIWKGGLSFGLVNIPVELRTAVRADHVAFRLLYKKDLSPVKYERYSKNGKGPLPWSEIIKGYEYQKGKYVVMTEDDFKQAALEASSNIDILDFVKQEEIDPRYFSTPYYLVPQKGGEKSYALLRDTLRDTNAVGIGKIILRTTQHLAGVKAVDNALVLDVMRFENELVDTDNYTFPPSTGVRPQELKMAKQLVHNLAGPFDPAKYTDEYRANLMKLIHAKTRGKPLKAAAPKHEEEDDKVIDLMARLRASLDQPKARGRKMATARKAPPA